MSAPDIRRLGHSGLQVSAVGLGCNNFGRRIDLDATRAVVDAAIEQGVTFFDTADVYGQGQSETLLGEVLQGRRDRVVLATKFGMEMSSHPLAGKAPRGSRAYIEQGVPQSLRRLRTDVIDLLWYHAPDGETPIAETLGALDDLVRAGTVRAIGASNFSADQIREADRVAREHGFTRFTAIQNEYSLLEREPEQEVLGLCEELELGFVPYFPLASGLLTGKYRRGEAPPPGTRLAGREEIASEAQWELVEALGSYAEQRRLPLVSVAIGALLARAAVASVIAGATTPEQVAGNAAGSAWQPSREDRVALEELLASHPL